MKSKSNIVHIIFIFIINKASNSHTKRIYIYKKISSAASRLIEKRCASQKHIIFLYFSFSFYFLIYTKNLLYLIVSIIYPRLYLSTINTYNQNNAEFKNILSKYNFL